MSASILDALSFYLVVLITGNLFLSFFIFYFLQNHFHKFFCHKFQNFNFVKFMLARYNFSDGGSIRRSLVATRHSRFGDGAAKADYLIFCLLFLLKPFQ